MFLISEYAFLYRLIKIIFFRFTKNVFIVRSAVLYHIYYLLFDLYPERGHTLNSVKSFLVGVSRIRIATTRGR